MSFAGDPIAQPVTFRPSRSIGPIYADATISETGTDEVTITEHPVQQGAAITDHAYVNPPGLMIEAEWSNSSPQAGGDPSYCTTTYQQLLALKDNRVPFDIVTPQRTYTNMLIRTLTKRTDRTTENALSVAMTCRNIIIVQTQTSVVPKADVQKSPQKTAPVQNAGNKQTVPATNYNPGP